MSGPQQAGLQGLHLHHSHHHHHYCNNTEDSVSSLPPESDAVELHHFKANGSLNGIAATP